MKRIGLTILIVAATLMAFTSCKKDEPEPPTPPVSNNQGEATNTTNIGVYNPKKKISKIYREDSYSEGKKLQETWTWDGDLLSKITESDGDVTWFEYDNKRIKTVRRSNGWRDEFSYDGKKLLSCISYNQSGAIETMCNFTCDGQKITKMDITEMYYRSDMTSYSESYTFDIKWAGDNASQSIYAIQTADEGNDEGEYWEEIEDYTYDEYYNPFCGSLYHFVWSGEASSLSQNNAITQIIKDSEHTSRYEYTYTYDNDKFPTEQKHYGEEGYYSINYIEYQ